MKTLFIFLAAAMLSSQFAFSQFCGFPDADPGGVTPRFVTFPASWNNNIITYFFANGTPDIANEQNVIRTALTTWEQAASVRFVQVCNANDADIIFAWQVGNHGDAPCPANFGCAFDGRFIPNTGGGTLAHAYPPPAGVDWDHLSGLTHFDEAEDWSAAAQTGAVNQPIDLQAIALHEIGHAVGLRHSQIQNTTAIMHQSFYNNLSGNARRVIANDDINGIRALYGTGTLIGGPNTVCTANASYVLESHPAGTTITWTRSSNLQYVSGQGTTNYVVRATTGGTGPGWVEANIASGCGNTTIRRNITSVGVPGNFPQAYGTSITKQDPPPYSQLCNSGTINYLKASYTGPGVILEYQWSVPSGWTVSPEGSDNSVGRVQTGFSSTGGTIQVRARNSCGWSGWNSRYYDVISCNSFFSNVFPNPADEELVIQVEPQNSDKQLVSSELIQGEYQIELYNNFGKKEIAFKTSEKEVKIRTKSLRDGVYQLKIIHQEGEINHKVLIEH